MIIIRLIRIGKKNSSSFRLVLTDKKNPPRGGRFLEILGNYNPRKKEIKLEKERINYWLSQGAKASDTVHNLLVGQGVIKGPKIKKKIKIKKKAEEAKKEEIGKEAAKEEAKEEVKEKLAEKTEEVKEEPVKEQAEPEEKPAVKKEEETPNIDKSEKEK